MNNIFINVVVGAVCSGFFSLASAQKSPWTRKNDMPTARLGLVTTVVNEHIYAIGGYAAANHPGMTITEVYDPVSDKWDSRAPMPTGRRWMAASAEIRSCIGLNLFVVWTNFMHF